MLSIERKRVLVQVLSPRPSVGLSMCPSVCPVHYGKTADLYDIWDGWSVGSKDEAGNWSWWLPHGNGQFWGWMWGISGDFVA